MRKIPHLIIACCFIFLSFSDKKISKTYWYKSTTGKGYIAIQNLNNDNPTLKTTVNAYFGNEKLNFSLITTNNTKKLANASKIEFNGSIDSNIDPVVYTGQIVKSNRNASFWNFTGDFKNEITNDPEVNQFLEKKHQTVLRIPNRTIPSFNVWAIVPKLPFNKKEGTFRFNSLDETKLYVRKNQEISYLGKEIVEINGNDVKLHKFLHLGEQMKPAYYWVNQDRELVKILLDNKFEFVLTTKKEALDSE